MRFFRTDRLLRLLSGYILTIILFGYISTITFFPHTHIVDGVTIVHSHPYKSNTGDVPVNHNHSRNGFHLIQFTSCFIATVSVFFVAAEVLRKVLNVLLPFKDEFFLVNFIISSANRTRGPTFLLHN